MFGIFGYGASAQGSRVQRKTQSVLLQIERGGLHVATAPLNTGQATATFSQQRPARTLSCGSRCTSMSQSPPHGLCVTHTNTHTLTHTHTHARARTHTHARAHARAAPPHLQCDHNAPRAAAVPVGARATRGCGRKGWGRRLAARRRQRAARLPQRAPRAALAGRQGPGAPVPRWWAGPAGARGWPLARAERERWRSHARWLRLIGQTTCLVRAVWAAGNSSRQ